MDRIVYRLKKELNYVEKQRLSSYMRMKNRNIKRIAYLNINETNCVVVHYVK